uniref:Uncharacterized protein n=1 Tax=Arundo donax TaxID=35708 RepID=A0A0A8YS82_ARUDO
MDSTSQYIEAGSKTALNT